MDGVALLQDKKASVAKSSLSRATYAVRSASARTSDRDMKTETEIWKWLAVGLAGRRLGWLPFAKGACSFSKRRKGYFLCAGWIICEAGAETQTLKQAMTAPGYLQPAQLRMY